MSWIDWLILGSFLAYTIWDGTRGGKQAKTITDYFLANRTMPWWAMGLSVMATQASAITFIGTTGQAFTSDMRFIQIYLSMPFAMIILSVTLIPFYHKLKNFSAYEVLEERFGLKTRLLTSGLFLISRGLALGTIIAAPAYVLSLLLHISLPITIMIMGLIATVYTMFGGISGVIRTDVKQMSIMSFGIFFSLIWIYNQLPDSVSLDDTLYLAGSLNKLKTVDFSWDLSNKYTVWSGFIAGLFLMLSYFGTDQSQVQRYLTAKSQTDAQQSLLLSAFAKIPLQFIILFLGVLLYVFFIFNPMPLSFRAADVNGVQTEQTAQEFSNAESAYSELAKLRKENALKVLETRSSSDQKAFVASDKALMDLKKEEMSRRAAVLKTDLNDTNYIFPYFIISYLPIGIIGLIISAIFAAALSSIDSELNALSTCSIVDWYYRLHETKKSDAHYLNSSKAATLFWGVLATFSAIILGETKSIIELVNQIGSYFYGSILGVFILLLFFKRVGGNAAFVGLLLGMIVVFLADSVFYNSVLDSYFFHPSFTQAPVDSSKVFAFLWLNPLGTFTVVLVGLIYPRNKIE
jgi:Na+/proline symporter